MSTNIHTCSVREWLRKRHRQKSKAFYVKSQSQLKTQYEAENTFFKFDNDCSGTLDLNELHEFFRPAGIRIEKKGLTGIFKDLDKDKNGCLSLNEFKSFFEGERYQKLFRNLVKDVREKQGTVDVDGFSQIPFSFSVMLEYLATQNHRSLLYDKIESEQNNKMTLLDAQESFCELFRYSVAC